MTLTKKSEQSGLNLEIVQDLATAEGISVGADEELSKPDAMKLGKAVKAFQEKASPAPAKEIRYWSKGSTRILYIPDYGPIKFNKHMLVCNPDDEVVGIIARLKAVSGIFVVSDEGFGEDTPSYDRFEDMLRSLAFAAGGSTPSKHGVKAIRAMFTADQLEELGDKSFDPRRLISKALRSKSLIPVGNLRPIF